MSQRPVLRAFVLVTLAALLSAPAAAQDITFSPSLVSFAVGEASPLITAQVTFDTFNQIGGTQTLLLGYDFELPYGLSTVPSPITFTTTAGQTSATVTFRLVAEPWVFAGGGEIPVYSSPDYSYGLLNYEIRPVSVQPKVVSVVAGQLSDELRATVNFGYSYPQGPLELVFSGLPPGAAPSPDPVTLTVEFENDVPYAVAPFRIATDPSTPPGTYEVAVGYDFQFFVDFGAGRIRPLEVISDTFLLTVEPSVTGSLSVTAEKASLDLCPGGAAVAGG